MAENRVIGRDGALPWHLPNDLKFFKKLTIEGTVLMGRKTFASIGRPLPRRRNLVLSRSGFSGEGIEVFSNMASVNRAVSAEERVFIIGGAEIYRITMDFWDEVYLTRVKGEFVGDAVMPEFEERFRNVETVLEDEDFSILRFD